MHNWKSKVLECFLNMKAIIKDITDIKIFRFADCTFNHNLKKIYKTFLK